MTLTKEESKVLKILVSKELEHVRKDGEQVFIVNSPFLTKVVGDQPDLPFLKSIELYKVFLEELEKKL